MGDLEFLLLSSHIFQMKDPHMSSCHDTDLPTLSKWLLDTNKLRDPKNINPEESVEISLNDPRIIDLLNTCNPSMATKFTISTEDDKEMLKRLRFQNSRKVIYESDDITFSIPVLHGGEIHVIGNVSGDDLLHLINNSPPGVVMSTRISIDGSLSTDSTEDVTSGIMDKLVDILYNTDDSEMLEFRLSFDDGEDIVSGEMNIRGWKIESGIIESSDKSFITVRKIHSLQ